MRTRAIASVAVAMMVVLGTSACGFITPQSTLEDYSPSDGVGATIGDVRVLNAIVLSEDGDDGALLASVVNQSDHRIQLTFQYESGAEKVDKKFTVGAGETQQVGTQDGLQITLSGIDAMPGDLLPIYVQYGDVSGKQLLVPVLDGSLAEYAELLP